MLAVASRYRENISANDLIGLAHDGDSISMYQSTLLTFPWRYWTRAPRFNGFSIAGACIQAATNATNNLEGRIGNLIQERPKVISIFDGANDLSNAVYTDGADFVNKALWPYVAKLKSRLPGVKVAVGTILNQTGNATHTARRAAANTAIRAGVGNQIDAVFDFANHPIMGTDAAPSDSTIFQGDGLHPTDLGQAYLAEVYRPAIDSLLGISDPFTVHSTSSGGTNPHSLTQFTHYWDAGDENTVLGATFCARIEDQIGSLPLQNVFANKVPKSKANPLRVNGLNTILMNSAGYMRSPSAVTVADTFHAFLAVQLGLNVQNNGYIFGLENGSTNRVSLLVNGSGTHVSCNMAGVGAATFTCTGAVPTSAPVLFEVLNSGGTIIVRQGGTQIGSATGFTGWAGNPITVAVLSAVAAASFQPGQFLALGISNTEITGTTLTNTRSYFTSRWGT